MRPIGLDPGAIVPAIVNRTLEREAWAQTCLAAHAGREFTIVVGPARTRMRIDATGRLEAVARSDSAPDLTLTLSAFAVPDLLGNPARWDELVVAEGDGAMAATLKGLAETLPWFVERAFAATLGPIIGQRVADLGRGLLAFPGFAAQRVAESASTYVRDESGMAATAEQARLHTAGVAELSDAVDAAAARLDALAGRLPPGPGP